MRFLHIALLFVCASLCGCAGQMEEVQRTGHGVSLNSAEREVKVGY